MIHVIPDTAWQLAAPGVWSLTVGSPQGLTPLFALKIKPRTSAMRQLPEASMPLAGGGVTCSDLAAGGSLLSLPLTEDEALYGTGLQFMRMNQRGRTRYLRVNSDPKQDTGETHAPAAFLVSDRGYGILVDCSRAVTFYCGSTLRQSPAASAQARDRTTNRSEWKATPVSDRIEIRLPAEGAHIYLFAGPELQDVVQRYNLFCGGGVLPPRWGLGFWHRTHTLHRDTDVENEAAMFRDRGVPCDVLGLEPGWHSASYPTTYEWDQERFPDPERFVKGLAARGFKVNLWEHPYVSPQSELFTPLQPFSGSHAVWGGLAPDYTLDQACVLYSRQHEEKQLSLGIAGYKHDECDGSELTRNSWMFPPHATFPSGHDGEQMRQLYGLLFQQMGDRMFRARGKRTYGLVRASNIGASHLPYVLYSDLYDHRQFVRALCNTSFCGLLWTPEVRTAISAEDWVRRMQTVCFSPLAMLNAWGDGKQPWSYPEAEEVVKHYIRLRMRLLPYLYTAFAEYEATGMPPFRAMPLMASRRDVHGGAQGSSQENLAPQHVRSLAEGEASANAPETPDIANTTDGAYGRQKEREWDDQFGIGRDLLVAPLFAGETSRDILLPEGVWYEAETGERYEGGRVIHITCPIERMPLLIREGAIIPMMPALDHVPGNGEKIPVELVHFGQTPGESQLYDDDGETFDFETDGGCWRNIQVVKAEDGGFQGTVEDADCPACRYVVTGWRFGQTRIPPE